jgi:hypothetical protein
MMSRHLVAVLLALAFAGAARAQTSASFKLTEFTLNNGGDPVNGSTAASASHHVTLDAIGDGVIAVALASASYHADAGFVDAYPPPGEVVQVRFTDKQTVVWQPEWTVGSYDVYRDGLSTLPGGSTGTCFASVLTAETATDAASPSSGSGYFYLVTAKNRLGEEGTRGFRTSGERPNAPACP